jgi:hypothetical protein
VTDLERRLVESLDQSSDLLEEWVVEADLPPALAGQAGQAVAVFRVLARAVAMPR